MNDIKIYEREEFGQVRTWTDEQGTMWYCAKDVCDYLGYRNITTAMRQHVKPSDMIKHTTELAKYSNPHKTVVTSMLYINKGGFYSLVLHSKMPKAQAFYDAVTHEVLPSVEEKGFYMTPALKQRFMTDPDFVIAIATQWKEELAQRQQLETQNTALIEQNIAYVAQIETMQVEHEEEVKAIEQKADQRVQEVEQRAAEQTAYLAVILSTSRALLTTQIAKDYGMSARRFNILLHEVGIQYKVGSQWVLYDKYDNCGYVVSDTFIIRDGAGNPINSRMQTLWTQKGREFIYDKLKSIGILPLIERTC